MTYHSKIKQEYREMMKVHEDKANRICEILEEFDQIGAAKLMTITDPDEQRRLLGLAREAGEILSSLMEEFPDVATRPQTLKVLLEYGKKLNDGYTQVMEEAKEALKSGKTLDQKIYTLKEVEEAIERNRMPITRLNHLINHLSSLDSPDLLGITDVFDRKNIRDEIYEANSILTFLRRDIPKCPYDPPTIKILFDRASKVIDIIKRLTISMWTY